MREAGFFFSFFFGVVTDILKRLDVTIGHSVTTVVLLKNCSKIIDTNKAVGLASEREKESKT